MRTLLCLCLLLLASLSIAGPAAAQLIAPLTTSDGRIACTQGQTGIGRPSDWRAVRSDRALGGWALTEMAKDTTELHFPICVSEQTVALDLDAFLRFMPVSGTVAQSAGLILRARNASDYYVVVANALDGSVRLFRMERGRRSQIAVKTGIGIELGKWHELRVTLVKDSFTIALDGTQVLTASDRSLPLAGPVGVWSQSDSVTYFGALAVALPMPPQAQPQAPSQGK